MISLALPSSHCVHSNQTFIWTQTWSEIEFLHSSAFLFLLTKTSLTFRGGSFLIKLGFELMTALKDTFKLSDTVCETSNKWWCHTGTEKQSFTHLTYFHKCPSVQQLIVSWSGVCRKKIRLISVWPALSIQTPPSSIKTLQTSVKLLYRIKFSFNSFIIRRSNDTVNAWRLFIPSQFSSLLKSLCLRGFLHWIHTTKLCTQSVKTQTWLIKIKLQTELWTQFYCFHSMRQTRRRKMISWLYSVLLCIFMYNSSFLWLITSSSKLLI